MLEKKTGMIHVDKLRDTLLMEADFNFANKLILGDRRNNLQKRMMLYHTIRLAAENISPLLKWTYAYYSSLT